jgi:hypothetical protein
MLVFVEAAQTSPIEPDLPPDPAITLQHGGGGVVAPDGDVGMLVFVGAAQPSPTEPEGNEVEPQGPARHGPRGPTLTATVTDRHQARPQVAPSWSKARDRGE